MSIFKTLLAQSHDDGFGQPSSQMSSMIGSMVTEAGVGMSPEQAVGVSTYFACMRVVSEDIGKLPLKTYERLDGREKRLADDHAAFELLHDAPNEETTAQSFRETLTAHAAGWGGGFAEIQRSRRGRPVAMYVIHPSRVVMKRAKDGSLYYAVRSEDSVNLVPIEARDMFHLHGLGEDSLTGYSIAALAAQSLGLARAAEQFGASFFRNGASLSGVLEHPANLSDEALKHLRDSWQRKYGGANNAGSVAILEEGMKYEKIGIPPEQAQFLETRQFSVEEVCRWWRVPPVKVGHNTATPYANIEALNLAYVNDALMPWAVRWEQEARRKLFMPDERKTYFVEHLFQGLLRGDTQARAEYYSKLYNVGALSPNDIRAYENLNPREGGDEYFVAVNMQGSQGTGMEDGVAQEALLSETDIPDAIDDEPVVDTVAEPSVYYIVADVPEKYEGIDFSPPQDVREAYRNGIKRHEDGETGDGIEDVTIRMARAFAGGADTTPDWARKGNRWWGRNERFKDEEPGTPAYAAAQLWGGRNWFGRIVEAMDRADEKESEATVTRTKAVMHSVLSHACGKVLGIEEKALSRAIAKYEADDNAFVQWAGDFYSKQVTRATSELMPACESLYLSVGGSDVVSMERAVCSHVELHLHEARQCVDRDAEAYLSEVGKASTPSKMAEQLADAVVALALEQSNDSDE